MTDTWRPIEGYRWPYRINEDGEVQKFYKGEWVTLKPYFRPNNNERARMCVKMRTSDNRQKEVPLAWLMADAFMGGRRPGYAIIHKDGQKTNFRRWNLQFATMSEAAKLGAKNRRKPVAKIDRDGNVVEIYSSATEAAKANFMSRSSICLKCEGKIMDPRRTDGFDYKYEDDLYNKKPGRKKRENTEEV